MQSDVIVIGAGVVGSAIAFGLAKEGARVLVLDGGDGDHRAARANFGLVWVQGKGVNLPPYARFTRASSDLWPEFRDDLQATAGQPVNYARDGGLVFCLGEEEYDARLRLLGRMHNLEMAGDIEMLDRVQLERLLPGMRLGGDVTGASYCAADGHVNPLQLLAALHRAIAARGGDIRWRSSVRAIEPDAGGFRVATADAEYRAPQVVAAAGHSSPALVAPLGIDAPIRAERGQILVTERTAPVLPYPASGLRQTAEGTVTIGGTHEDVGMDCGVTVESAVGLARRAMRVWPDLARLRLVRQWSGLRVLSPDTGPIYARAEDHPGLTVALCHSGVTLAAAHAGILAPALAAGRFPDAVTDFNTGRFDVSKCA